MTYKFAILMALVAIAIGVVCGLTLPEAWQR